MLQNAENTDKLKFGGRDPADLITNASCERGQLDQQNDQRLRLVPGRERRHLLPLGRTEREEGERGKERERKGRGR